MIRKIVLWSKYIAAIGGAVAVLWAGFSSLHKAIDNVGGQNEVLTEIQNQQEVILDSIYSLSTQVKDLTLTTEGVNDNTVLIGNYVKGVDKAFTRHLQLSPEVTKEDYANMMQIIEELKKNDSQTALK